MVMETRDWTYKKILESDKYVVSRRLTGVSDGDSESIVLSVPSDKKRVFVSKIEVKSSGEADADIVSNASIDTSGTDLTPVNLHVNGSNDTGYTTAEHSGSYSGGTDLTLGYIPSASGGLQAGGTTKEEVFVLEPGVNAQFRATNISGSNSTMFLKVVWHENVDT